MASITTWIRLEPRARDPEMTPGVEARVHDPLWMLARQWQLGELDGEDGGSAIVARARVDVGRLRAYQPVGGAQVALDGRLPLSALVEAERRESERPFRNVHQRAQAGRHLLRMLREEGLQTRADTFIDNFGLDGANLDEQDARFLAALRGRAPDGVELAIALRTSLPDLPAGLDIPAGVRETVVDVCTRWLAWYDALELDAPSNSAWQRDRLEYAFSLHASLGGERVALRAAEHHGSTIGWTRFDAQREDGEADPPDGVVSTSIPAPVRYRGMPARRYWELEDGAVDWGAIDASPGDVARMLLVDFALVFSDDWLLIPIDLDADTLARVSSLVVTDTFGVRTLVRSAAELDGNASPWKLFTLRGLDAPTLLVAPRALHLEGAPREQVSIAKDELSNLVWAMEDRAVGADGRSREVKRALPTGERPPGLHYRIGTGVPSGWHPYRPRKTTTGIELLRAAVPGATTSPATALVSSTTSIAEEEIAGAAARITEYPRLVRTASGALVAWSARQREITKPGPGSGLAFDVIERGEDQ